MRIGLLEDDTAIQEMLLLVLEDEGYTVINYADADECLAALGISTSSVIPSLIDLMIIDWRLNGSISGTEVIQQIRKHSSLDTLPIILTTAATFSDTEALHNLHVVLLQKPFSVDEILSLISRLVQQQPSS